MNIVFNVSKLNSLINNLLSPTLYDTSYVPILCILNSKLARTISTKTGSYLFFWMINFYLDRSLPHKTNFYSKFKLKKDYKEFKEVCFENSFVKAWTYLFRAKKDYLKFTLLMKLILI